MVGLHEEGQFKTSRSIRFKIIFSLTMTLAVFY